MSDELRYVNAFIGFCKHTGGWPAPLAPLRYIACGYEREIKLIRNGRDRTVTVDLICASDHVHHAVCLEMKSQTLHEDQLQNYLAIRPRNLLQLGGLPETINPRALTHDVVYVSEESSTAALIRQLDAIQTTVALLAGDEERFSLVHGEIEQEHLAAIFGDGVMIDPDAWPRSYVPFNSRSPDSEIAAYVISGVQKFIMDGIDFSIDDVVRRSVRHWEICGRAERQRLRTKISRIIDRASREELDGYYLRPSKDQAWTVLQGRRTHPSQRQTLFNRSAGFVERLEKGIQFVPGQLDLGPAFYDIPFDEEDDDFVE